MHRRTKAARRVVTPTARWGNNDTRQRRWGRIRSHRYAVDPIHNRPKIHVASVEKNHSVGSGSTPLAAALALLLHILVWRAIAFARSWCTERHSFGHPSPGTGASWPLSGSGDALAKGRTDSTSGSLDLLASPFRPGGPPSLVQTRGALRPDPEVIHTSCCGRQLRHGRGSSRVRQSLVGSKREN